MRPLQNQGNLATPSPHRSKTKISLNLSVLPVDAIKRLKREHAKDLSGRKSHASPPELERAPSSQSSKRSSDGKSSTTQKISPSWSPKRNTSPYRKRSRSPRLEPLAKKRKTPPKTSSNRLEVPQPSSKPGSRLDTRTPSPLNSATAQLRKIFGKRCCAPQTCPRTSMLPAIANIPAERSAATAFILELAREKKHAADKENKNKMKKFFNYLETIIYYIYANSHEDDPVALFNNCCQTLNFTKQIQKQATRNSLNSDYDRHFFSRFQVLIRRCQSCLAFVLFDALQDSTNKRNDMIQKLDSRFRPNISSDLTSMTSLKTYADVNETITVNKNLYILQMQQMKVFTHLYYAHRIWKDNDVSMSPLERGMVEEMDRVCGKLYIHAPLPLVTEWMFTALTWLRDEYSEGSCQPA
ncbi:hypothetical protein L596_023788 [Steinernema carpocapsae]|uniref:AF4/FMR2 C-terminal homology domain-containing protein n=1 Tax=Steinernema carpocapsae TaxID=34508 RepID=A0A4U5MFH2_STECR|nr:hypothetical protein L596_023788 [Steinernema carpocapsae]